MSFFNLLQNGGDIWSLSGIVFESNITDILSTNNYLLEDLLKEDQLLQEVKYKNSDLIDFICKDDTISKITKYLTVSPERSCDDFEKYKYPYVCCEIICCQIPEILDAFTDGEHLNDFMNFICCESSIDHYLAGYFEKILDVLLRNKTSLMMNYINSRSDGYFSEFIKHIDNFAVAQIIQRFLLPHIPYIPDTLSEKLSEEEKFSMQCQWAHHNFSCDILIEMLLTTNNSIVINHITDLFIIIIQLSPIDANFLQRLYHHSIFDKLLQQLFGYDSKMTIEADDTKEISIVSLIECLLSRLYENYTSLEFEGVDIDEKAFFMNNLQTIINSMLLQVEPILNLITEKIRIQSEILIENHAPNNQTLGQKRLFYIKLLEAVIRFGNDSNIIDRTLIKLNTIEIVLGYFKLYPLHSVVHLSIQRMISMFLANEDQRRDIFKYLLGCQSFNLSNFLVVEIMKANEVTIGQRLPYLGHLVFIAQTLHSTLKQLEDNNDSILLNLIDVKGLEDWKQFTTNILLPMTTYPEPIISKEIPQNMDNASTSRMFQDEINFDEEFEDFDENYDHVDFDAINFADFTQLEQADDNAANTSEFASFGDWNSNEIHINLKEPDDFSSVSSFDPFANDGNFSIDSIIDTSNK